MKLKPGWTKVRFGDVVQQVKDKVDPDTSGLERYIAGEHMDTDDLKIRRWGIIGDGYLGPAFHMRFKPGQVLYGSRRTYLRKVAVADFEGITANTTYVLESKNPDLLLPNFLPYLMQTDAFHEHSIQQSKGSVNPYINFSDLTWFEFALPPIEEQQRIVNILKKAQSLNETVFLLETKHEEVIYSAAVFMIEKLNITNYKTANLAEICVQKPQSGIYKPEEFRGNGVPMVRMGELFGNDIIDSTLQMEGIQVSESELNKYRLTSNDILFGRRSVVLEGAGKPVLVQNIRKSIIFESSILRVTIDTKVALPQYVFEWLKSPLGQKQISSIVTFTTVSGVAGSDIAKLKIPLPEINIQYEFYKRLQLLRNKMYHYNHITKRVNTIYSILLNKLEVN